MTGLRLVEATLALFTILGARLIGTVMTTGALLGLVCESIGGVTLDTEVAIGTVQANSLSFVRVVSACSTGLLSEGTFLTESTLSTSCGLWAVSS